MFQFIPYDAPFVVIESSAVLVERFKALGSQDLLVESAVLTGGVVAVVLPALVELASHHLPRLYVLPEEQLLHGVRLLPRSLPQVFKAYLSILVIVKPVKEPADHLVLDLKTPV